MLAVTLPAATFIAEVTAQQGVPGDAVPWPEREVSSLPFSSPAAAGGTGKLPEWLLAEQC